jgi:hypothetical protein
MAFHDGIALTDRLGFVNKAFDKLARMGFRISEELHILRRKSLPEIAETHYGVEHGDGALSSGVLAG